MADLTKLRTMCKVGTIRLHRPFITRDEESRAKCLSASKEIVEIARDMAKTNEIYWQIPVHVRYLTLREHVVNCVMSCLSLCIVWMERSMSSIPARDKPYFAGWSAGAG
jgi:hypothetical protein